MAKTIKNSGLNVTITVESWTPEIKAALDNAVARALLAIGERAEGHARDIVVDAGRVDTGNLQTSITHREGDDFTAIGTNVKYAIYHEVGTGIYASQGGGRKTPWWYKDAKGEWHVTRGVKPLHFLTKAVTENADEYKQLIKDSLENA